MARLNAGMLCIKYIIFISNFLFVCMGILLLSIGTALLTVYKDFDLFLESHHFKPAEILIAIGVIVFFVSFLGCVGAARESTMLVNLHGLFLLLLLVLEISAGISAFVMRWTVLDDIKENMLESMRDYKEMQTARDTWDYTQKNLGCCGVEFPHDWASEHVPGHAVIIAGQLFTVPTSCCKNVKGFCEDIYRRGCLNVLESYVSDSSLAVGYVAIGVAVIQLLGVIIAFSLAKAIRRVKTEQERERQENRERFFQQRVIIAPTQTSSSTDA